MYTKCPECKKGIEWSYERSVYRPDSDIDEDEQNEIQCPECDCFITVD